MSDESHSELPDFLRTYEDLHNHLIGEMDGLPPSKKGEIFAHFVSKIIRLSDYGLNFGELELGPLSHDGGVDLISKSTDQRRSFLGQTKLHITKVDDFDLILSKFANYSSSPNKKGVDASQGKLDLYPDETKEDIFAIITLSKLNSIVSRFEEASRPTKQFYNELKNSGRLVILDGPKILPLIQAEYRKRYALPANVKLHFDIPFINKGGYIWVSFLLKKLRDFIMNMVRHYFSRTLGLFLVIRRL
jgi:hypothetical protein